MAQKLASAVRQIKGVTVAEDSLCATALSLGTKKCMCVTFL